MKNSSPIIHYLLPILFVCILLLPQFNSITKIWQFDRKSENRAFKDSISIDIKHLDNFPKDFNNYYNDNFSFRTPLLDLYHKIKFFYFKVSPYPDKVIVGKKGWFFRAGKELSVFQGNKNFSDKDLETLKDEWIIRKAYLDSLNIKLYWLIAPIKQHVYPEYMPSNVKGAKERRVTLMKDYLDDFLPNLIIDVTPEILEEKKKDKLFYKLDNHWNQKACFFTSKILLDKIKQDFPNHNIPTEPKVFWKDTTLKQGIHYNTIGINSLSETDFVPVFTPTAKKETNYGFPPPCGFAYPWEYEHCYKNPKITNGVKVLVIRDSFFQHIIPFFAESVQESVYIFDAWQYQLNKEIVEKVKPDVVIFETLEVHIEPIINLHNKNN